MLKMTALVMKSDAETVSRKLLALGNLHLMSVQDFEPGQKILSKINSEYSSAQLAELRSKIEGLLSITSVRPEISKSFLSEQQDYDLSLAQSQIDKAVSEVQQIRDTQLSLQKEIGKLEDLQRQLHLIHETGPVSVSKKTHAFLNVHTGKVPLRQYGQFRQSIEQTASVHFLIEKNDMHATVLLITMKRDEKAVAACMRIAEWSEISLPSSLSDIDGDAENQIQQRISGIKKLQNDAAGKVSETVTMHSPQLEKIWRQIRLIELTEKIKSFSSCTSRTVIIAGWIPKEEKNKFQHSMNDMTSGRCYIEWNEAEKMSDTDRKKVPVLMRTPSFLSPFQFLIDGYAVPAYGSINPAPFTALAYLLMFGLMFADAGHGIVLALMGIAAGIIIKKKDSASYKISRLLIPCGASAVISGILFGSWFGFPLTKALWFNYHEVLSGHGSPASGFESVYDILGLTVFFGIGVISAGLLLNWINLARAKKYFLLFFDKAGIIGGWLYIWGVYSGIFFVRSAYRALPDKDMLTLVFGIPILLLSVKPVYEFLHEKKHNSSLKFSVYTPAILIMNWLVELLEIFSGYLANTLSFMRVAGLGIAHVSLMSAFASIAAMTGRTGPAAIVILIFGNILVIGMEGLSAGIQSLRLNYYEFFTKFFSGRGIAYNPISFKTK